MALTWRNDNDEGMVSYHDTHMIPRTAYRLVYPNLHNRSLISISPFAKCPLSNLLLIIRL